MLRDEAVTEIREGLGFNTRLDADYLVRALQTAQRNLEKSPELPWFLRVFEHPLVTVADTDTISLPSNFLRDVETGSLFVINTSGTPRSEVLKSPFYQDLDFDGDGVAEGKPVYYRLEIENIRLYPTPDQVYNLRFNYFKKADVLDSNIENLWLEHAPDVMIGFAGQVIAGKTRDAKSYQLFSDLRARGEASLALENVARRETGVQYQMGGPH